MADEINHSDEEWRKKLTPEQYRVLRERGTEAPFSGEYVDTKEKGVFKCAGCENVLFSSDNKFNSGTGWPSFDRVLKEGAVKLNHDSSHGIERTEVVCAACDGHLGHVFPDGPTQTGQRYCINSCALSMEKE